MTRVARFLLLGAAVAAVLAATGADDRSMFAASKSVTLLDISKSHGPDPSFLVERARRGRESTSLVIFGAGGRVVADATPAELERRHPSGKLDDVFRQLTLPGQKSKDAA